MKSTFLFYFLGLRHTAKPSAWIASGFLWVSLTIIGLALLDLSPVSAMLGGLMATLLHWISELWHQYGHALAARRTGYPMQGIEFWWFFGKSIYPREEPELPARIHLRRAGGGIPASFLLTLVGGGVALALHASGGMFYWITFFFFLENFLVFFLGAFLPLGFTDGSTFLRYWREH